jgi:hypothetical protein
MEYESTGRKMQKPKVSTKVQAMRVAGNSAKNSVSAPASKPISDEPPVARDGTFEDIITGKKLFVHIKNPDDHDALLSLKQICSRFPGVSDIVLVLGEPKKSAIKMPFRVDPTNALIGELVKILGEDAVVLK